MSIKLRVFVVGCPRSGTTLLQKHLAAHSEIHSFPESHFFIEFKENPIAKRLGLHSLSKKRMYSEFLAAMGVEYREMPFPLHAYYKPWSIPFFIKTLDRLAERAQKKIWLEKTPDHLLRLEKLTDVATPCKVIHIVRNGKDVAASLREVSQQYPDIWDGPWHAERCAKRWNRSLIQTKKWKNCPDHYILRYERFIQNPEHTLQDLCRFLDIKYEDGMLSSSSKDASALVMANEEWKDKSLSDTIITKPSTKFERIFSEDEKVMVNRILLDLDQELGQI